MGLPSGSAGEESTHNAGDTRDLGSIPGLGRSPGGGNGNPLQYCRLKNLMNTGTRWGTAQRGKKLDTTECLSIPRYTESSGLRELQTERVTDELCGQWTFLLSAQIAQIAGQRGQPLSLTRIQTPRGRASRPAPSSLHPHALPSVSHRRARLSSIE